MTIIGTTTLLFALATVVVPQDRASFDIKDISPVVRLESYVFLLDEYGTLTGYQVNVKSKSRKIITAITWAYEATPHRAKGEVVREDKIVVVGGGRIVTRLMPRKSQHFDLPPPPDEPLDVTLILTKVEFEDGTVWQRASKVRT